MPDATKYGRETELDVASMKNCKMKTRFGAIEVSTTDVTLLKLFGNLETTDWFREVVDSWHMLQPTTKLELEFMDPGDNFANVLPYIEKYYEQI